jgi:CrcB protein
VKTKALLPPTRLSSLAAVAAGGALGVMARYAFLVLFPTTPGRFPWTIFAENLVGAFLLGFVLMLLTRLWRADGKLGLFVGTGVLGSFTTFSNYSLDVVKLAQGGWLGLALLYASLSLVLGMAAALAGVWLGQQAARAR